MPNAAINPNDVVLVVIVLLVLWRMYRRLQRFIGRQLIKRRTLIVRTAIFAIIGVVVLALSATRPIALLSGLAGLLAGAILAWYGLRITKLEATPQGMYYTPNRYIGLGVFALFLVRLVINLRPMITGMVSGTVASASVASSSPYANLTHNPVTTAVILLLFGYYCFYYGGLLRSSQSQSPDPLRA